MVVDTGIVLEESGSSKIIYAEVYNKKLNRALAVLEAITTTKRDRDHSAIYGLLDHSTASKSLLIGITVSSFYWFQNYGK